MENSKKSIEARRRAALPKESHKSLEKKLKEEERKNEELQAEHEKLGEHAQAVVQKSKIDSLTGISNREGFSEKMEELIRLMAYPLGKPLLPKHVIENRKNELFDRAVFLLIDIDDFKKFNTLYFHHGGDRVIKAIGKILERHARRITDFAGRWGGDEFVMGYPAGGKQAAIELAEAIRQDIKENAAQMAGLPPEEEVTVSIGVVDSTEITLEESAETYTDQLHRLAGECLKRSKDEGKDRIAAREPDENRQIAA